MKKSILSWSSGKDAAYTLLQLVKKGQKPDLLLTNINEAKQRVSMHGTRLELLTEQAKRLDIALYTIPLHEKISMDEYNKITASHLSKLKNKGYENIFFGDIFLEDLKEYRIRQMNEIGLKVGFPIWKRDTKQLAYKIIDSGIKAIITAVSADKLDKSFVGRNFDKEFLNDLPHGVDRCGENGEFHSFVYEHPLFSSPIAFEKGEIVFKKYKKCTKKDTESFSKEEKKNKPWDTGFWYIDLVKK